MKRLPIHSRPSIQIHGGETHPLTRPTDQQANETSIEQMVEPRHLPPVAPLREPVWLTPRQAAAYLGVGVDTIYEACAAAELKHVKLGYRTIRLRREWIDRWVEKRATPAE